MYLQKLLIIYGEEVEHIVLWSPNEQSSWSPNVQGLLSPNVPRFLESQCTRSLSKDEEKATNQKSFLKELIKKIL